MVGIARPGECDEGPRQFIRHAAGHWAGSRDRSLRSRIVESVRDVDCMRGTPFATIIGRSEVHLVYPCRAVFPCPRVGFLDLSAP